MQCSKCEHLGEEMENVCTDCGEILRRNAYAGFWIRFGACLIDEIILCICILVTFFIGLVIAGVIAVSGGNFDYVIGSIMLIGLCIRWLYYSLFESSRCQATPGKMAVGIRVVDLDSNRISFGRATGRAFSKVISLFTLFVGYIMTGVSDEKQALHDMLAGTLVISK